MKLQNMTVIFIIIMIPIIIVTSYYIGLQIKTITMQKDYTVKLQTAAKDSIQALEINTVEWNSNSANLADSKRRDVLASINTFTTSLANSMGIGGAGKGRIQTYIPAIVYTMYDGYYIYSASLMQDQDTTEKDENNNDVDYGRTQFDENNNIKYKGTYSYQYILKPYSPYSARYVRGNTDITVNYTLDNYIRVYGTVNGEYQAKEGYLVVRDDDAGVKNVKSGRISEITYRGATIKPEALTEQVYTDGEGVKEYPYIYDQYDNKLYWDKDTDPNKDGTNEGNYFSVDKNNNKVYLQTALPEGDAGFSITNRFRKISIPMESKGELTVQKVFQILNPGGGYKFYYENQSGAFVEFTNPERTLGTVKQEEDYSAINYCVESYVFTQWVTKNLGSITVGDMKSPTVGQYNNVKSTETIFDISSNNNPDPENDGAYATSVLAQHKKDIIINTIEKNLSQATEQAKEMNPNYEYRLPQLSYDEWEQALSNISIIAFMQGMPIGLKYYNNYAIATSTLNKEFVDPDELYFAGTGDQYYHQRQCDQATGSNYIGYRSIDYAAKSYETGDTTKYYYPHANGGNSELECYYCLVNRSTYNKAEKNAKWNDNPYSSWTDSYYNALARERYMQLDEPGTYKPNVTITKTASSGSVEYGGTVTYIITIKNNGIVEDTVNLLDFWDEEDFDSETIKIDYDKTNLDVVIDENKTIPEKNSDGTIRMDQDGRPIVKNGIFAEEIKIGAKQEKTLEYTIKVKGKLGEPLVNTAAVYSWGNNDVSIAEATATTTVKKTIEIAKKDATQDYNIVLLLDHSDSLNNNTMKIVYEGVRDLLGSEEYILGKLFPEGKESKSQISTIHFYGISNLKYGIRGDQNTCLNSRDKIKKALTNTYNSVTIFDTRGGTNYSAALKQAEAQFNSMNKISENKNVLVIFTDGAPTEPTAGMLGAIGYTIHQSDNGNYTYKEHKLIGSDSNDEEGGKGKNVWLEGKNTFLGKYEGIMQIVTRIKQNKNADIYCINYGDTDSTYGLRDMISSYKDKKKEEYYAYAENEVKLKTAFSTIGKSIVSQEINVPGEYLATNNEVELKEADKIQSIKIGARNYSKDEAKAAGIIEEKNGTTYLNLANVSLNQTITITY